VLKVVAARCCQGGIQLFGPFVVGLGESPHLIRSQAKITQYLPERLAPIDGVKELLPYFGG
jgi:hypothetical protein